MDKYKICVYAISKNEEHFVERWMDSVSEADLVVVLDTGSTDKTVEKLRRRGAVVYEEVISPWRFDKARNRALDHVPQNMDICVSNDIDEVFEPGWRKKLEDAWGDEYTRASYSFVWSHNPDGSIKKQYIMEKVHLRQNFRWVHPVHEVLEYSGTDEDKTVWVEGMVLHHYPDLSKPRSQYLPLLELSVQENPHDDRAMFWLGREYMYHKKYEQGIKTLEKHLSLPNAKWKEERSASMRYIAHCFKAMGNRKQALSWLYRAVAECPGVREPYLALAKMGYEDKNWPLLHAMVRHALAITHHSGSYLTESESWGSALYDLGAIAAYNLGLYDLSADHAEKACQLSPDDKRLKANLTLIRKKLDEKKGDLP